MVVSAFTVGLLVSVGASAGTTVEPARALVSAALQASDPVERERASRALLAAAPGGGPLLEHSLRDPDYRVRRRACRLLLKMGQERAVPLLVEGLNRHEPASDARVAMAWTAYRLGHLPALAFVEAELRSPWWHRRLNAVADLFALGDAGAADLLAHALGDPSWIVRHRALRALRTLDPRPYARLLAEAAADEEWVIRREALQALLDLGEPTGLSGPELDGLLARALWDPEPAIRRIGARAIAARAKDSLRLPVAAAFSAVHDGDPEVRAALVRALGHASDDEHRPIVRRALSDPSWWVRAAALEASRGPGSGSLPERLIATLDGIEPGQAERAARALKRVSDRTAVSLLVQAAARGDRVAPVARSVLAAFGRERGGWKDAVLEATRGLLSHRAPGMRALGVELAGELGERTLAPMVQRLLADASAAVQGAAVRALGTLASALGTDERAGAVTALRPLLERAGAPLEGVLRDVLRAFTRRGLPPASLRALAGTAVRWVRTLSLRALARLGAGADVALEALSDREPEVRRSAVATLAAALPPAVSDPFASLGLPAVGLDPRQTARSMAAIQACLADPEVGVRRAAARALTSLGSRSGVRELRGALGADLRAADADVRLRAAQDLARLGAEGDEDAHAALVPALVDADASVRAVARAALRQGPLVPALVAAAETAPAPLRYAAALLLARRGFKTGLAAELAPLAAVGPADAERVGEYRPERLARWLAEQVPARLRTPALREFLRRFVAPELISRLALRLGRDVATAWRGTPAYNMRRQNLFNAQIAEAVRELPGLHPKILKALLFQESNLEPLIGNRYDCVGLGAFCRRAAREEGLAISERFRDFENDPRYRPEVAIRAAVRHLRRKAELLEEDAFRRFGAPRGRDFWAFVLAAYNGGHEQVAQAMEAAYKRGLELAKARRLKGAEAAAFAREHATRWESLLLPHEEPEDSPLHHMTERRYPWYRPYGRYRKMTGAEAKYHEIGQFPLDVLGRAFEDEERP